MRSRALKRGRRQKTFAVRGRHHHRRLTDARGFIEGDRVVRRVPRDDGDVTGPAGDKLSAHGRVSLATTRGRTRSSRGRGRPPPRSCASNTRRDGLGVEVVIKVRRGRRRGPRSYTLSTNVTKGGQFGDRIHLCESVHTKPDPAHRRRRLHTQVSAPADLLNSGSQ